MRAATGRLKGGAAKKKDGGFAQIKGRSSIDLKKSDDHEGEEKHEEEHGVVQGRGGMSFQL